MMGKQRKRGKQRIVHEYQIDWRLENKENRENRGLYMNTTLTDGGKQKLAYQTIKEIKFVINKAVVDNWKFT